MNRYLRPLQKSEQTPELIEFVQALIQAGYEINERDIRWKASNDNVIMIAAVDSQGTICEIKFKSIHITHKTFSQNLNSHCSSSAASYVTKNRKDAEVKYQVPTPDLLTTGELKALLDRVNKNNKQLADSIAQLLTENDQLRRQVTAHRDSERGIYEKLKNLEVEVAARNRRDLAKRERLAKQIRQLETENDRLRKALGTVEFVLPPWPWFDEQDPFCPWCDRRDYEGHREDCQRQWALGDRAK